MWYYEHNDARQGPVDTDEITPLIRDGVISPATRVWTRGMADWTPAAQTSLAPQFINPQSSPPPLPADIPWQPSTLVLTGYRDLNSLAELLYGALLFSGGMALIQIWSSSVLLEALHHASNGQLGPGIAESTEVREALISLGNFFAVLISAILFFRWKFFAYRNVQSFDVQDLRFSPGWAVGSYFIPILSLWRPYQAMKEIWKGSEDPGNWHLVQPGFILNVWWMMWLVSSFIGNILFRDLLNDSGLGEMAATAQATIFSRVLEISVCLITGLLVHAIQQRQNKTARNLGFTEPE